MATEVDPRYTPGRAAGESTCLLCGATVHVTAQTRHDRWHVAQGRP